MTQNWTQDSKCGYKCVQLYHNIPTSILNPLVFITTLITCDATFSDLSIYTPRSLYLITPMPYCSLWNSLTVVPQGNQPLGLVLVPIWAMGIEVPPPGVPSVHLLTAMLLLSVVQHGFTSRRRLVGYYQELCQHLACCDKICLVWEVSQVCALSSQICTTGGSEHTTRIWWRGLAQSYS